MNLIRDIESDWIGYHHDDNVFAVLTPRALLVEPNGFIPMGRIGKWHMLFGGHAKQREMQQIFEVLPNLTPAAIENTVVAEVQEETKIDIRSHYRKSAKIFGVAHVDIVDRSHRTITHAVTPVVVCPIPGGLPFAKDVIKVPPGHIPQYTFPDAAYALAAWNDKTERMIRLLARFPDNLNDELVIFQTRPYRKYLHGEPPLHALGFVYDPEPIPKNYPQDLQRWLHQQHAKM